jgi:hypothetical protein
MVSAALIGCSGQGAFLSLHAIDTLQTMNGVALGPCDEIDPATSRIIGAKPSPAEVLAWSVGVTALYLSARSLAPSRIRPALDWTAASFKAVVVAHNTREGCQ